MAIVRVPIFIPTGDNRQRTAILNAEVEDGELRGATIVNSALGTLLAGALGNTADFDKETDDAVTLLGAEDYDRVVIGLVGVTEDFADGAGATPGTQTVFKVGHTGDGESEAFVADDAIVDFEEGAFYAFAGALPATEDLIVTGTAAVDGDGEGATASTGEIRVTVIALPVALPSEG